MPISVVLLIILAVCAAATAAVAVVGELGRREALGRASGVAGTSEDSRPSVLIGADESGQELSLEHLVTALGEAWKTDEATTSKLVQAGYDGAYAPVAYGAIRVALVLGVPLLTLGVISFFPGLDFTLFVMAVGASGLVGMALPMYFLARAVRLRQQRITRSLPDAMDLLVLCVEAGLGFDAAVLRVAREMQNSHPDIAGELLAVNRKVNAGVTRAEALRMAYTRTGVEELRIFVQHMIQSERLGTSVGQVLRAYGQTLRRTRKQLAERKAATAPLKMTIPMAFLIMPALFIVILGPAVVQIGKLFHPGR